MINKLLLGIIKLIVSLVTVILTPITAVGNFLNLISNGIGWVISLTGLSANAISLLVAYYVFILTAPMLFYMIKLALSWYNRLKP